MTDTPMLPPGFDALEPFVAQWAIAGASARAAQRSASSPEEREAFFAVAAPLLDSALGYLDRRRLSAFTHAERRLMDLMLSLAHVALAVEIQGPDEAVSARWRDRMRIDRSTSDQGIQSCST